MTPRRTYEHEKDSGTVERGREGGEKGEVDLCIYRYVYTHLLPFSFFSSFMYREKRKEKKEKEWKSP